MAEVRIETEEKIGVNFLYIDGVNWMVDDPEEAKCQQKHAAEAYGDVLVAGLGFGLYQQAAMKNPKVASVTTVEKYPEVIEACRKYDPTVFVPKHTIICSDWFSFQTDGKYDTVYGDIWTGAESVETWRAFKERALLFIKPGGLLDGWLIEHFEPQNKTLYSRREIRARKNR